MRIALIGSAPSSVRLAPYDDPSWEIWGCSPGVYAVAKRIDAWYELHYWQPPVIGDPTKQVPWFSPEYCQWMANLKCPVWMYEKIDAIPNSVAYPVEAMLNKYGPYFFTSSLSWMFAMALETPGVTDIGLWGVDMSAVEEYQNQRPGCHYFITIAMKMGIKVHVPPESDLLQPHPLYGIGESTPMAVKVTARNAELDARIAQTSNAVNQAAQELAFLKGARDNMDYVAKTWLGSVQVERVLMRMQEAAKRELPPPIPDSNVTQITRSGD